MLKPSNRQKYLRAYAEREAAVQPPAATSYRAAVVVPACGESHAFLDAWDRSVQNTRELALLVVLVVNADNQTPDAYVRANDELVTRVLSRPNRRLEHTTPIHLVSYANYDVLLISRSRPPHQLPDKCGVGLARKIGADVVCAWYDHGAIEVPWWMSTDADVALPGDICARLGQLGVAPTVVCLPFEHVQGDDPRVTDATWAVEVELRYHALGLTHAGSSYAWPALGSCLAIHTDTYATVRGFPKRQAGEDHYLLQKATKLAPIRFASGEPVRIFPRRSARTPFGTGRSVEELLSNDLELVLRNPGCYSWLRQVITQLNALGANGRWSEFCAWSTREVTSGTPVATALAEIGALDAWEDTCELNLNAAVRTRRLHEWFDGLRQIQFLRRLEASLPSLAVELALEQAPFTQGIVNPKKPAESRWFSLVQGLRQLSGPARTSLV